METETQRVLEMLQAGQITPEQAAKLLEALDTAAARPTPAGRPRTLRINVTDTRSGRTRVNVNVPLGLIEVASKLGLSLGIKRAPELAAVNFDEIMAAIKNGAEGKIVDIEDDDEGQHVVVMVD
jgi:hypothetical protein